MTALTTNLHAKHWIQTFTGRKFYPLTPDPRALDIRDQARALSMLCRYVGHVSRFYSVAEHAVRVSRKAEELGYNLYIQQWALIHDNSEAYLGDISRPVKHQAALGGYREAEGRLQQMIAHNLGLDIYEPEAVTWLDTEILGTEAYHLKSPVHPDWGATTATGFLPRPWKLGWFDRLGWSPRKAEKEYLKRFRYLWRMAEVEALRAA